MAIPACVSITGPLSIGQGRNGTFGVHVGSVLMINHVVRMRDLTIGICNDGKRQVAAHDLVNVLDPVMMRLEAIRALPFIPPGQLSNPAYVDCTSRARARRGRERTRPINLTPRLLNSGSSLANAPSSVVQVGVKSSCYK